VVETRLKWSPKTGQQRQLQLVLVTAQDDNSLKIYQNGARDVVIMYPQSTNKTLVTKNCFESRLHPNLDNFLTPSTSPPSPRDSFTQLTLKNPQLNRPQTQFLRLQSFAPSSFIS
jgi:hypothetical protein